MAGVLLGLHILISLALMIVVLLQSGKGGGLAGAFGGAGGVGAVFGGQTAADLLTKATRYLAIGFFVTSLSLALVSRERILGTVEGGLERRQSTPAAEMGEPIPDEGVPEGLPGASGETPGEMPEEMPLGLPDEMSESTDDAQSGAGAEQTESQTGTQ